MSKILVAEDDRLLAQYYKRLLSQWNCETVIEHTGTDAIRRAATFRPDVVLLGIVIPEMGGVEAAIKLLEICPRTKIVLVPESVPPKVLEQLEAQGYYFLTLPDLLARRSCTRGVRGRSRRSPEVSETGHPVSPVDELTTGRGCGHTGYPIFQTHRFGDTLQVEVNAFEVSESGNGAAELEKF